MLVVRRGLDVANLLMHIALHPAAEGRVELRQIANLQETAVDAEGRPAVLDQPECSLRYRSASIAAAQPEPAAVTACL